MTDCVLEANIASPLILSLSVLLARSHSSLLFVIVIASRAVLFPSASQNLICARQWLSCRYLFQFSYGDFIRVLTWGRGRWRGRQGERAVAEVKIVKIIVSERKLQEFGPDPFVRNMIFFSRKPADWDANVWTAGPPSVRTGRVPCPQVPTLWLLYRSWEFLSGSAAVRNVCYSDYSPTWSILNAT